MITDVIDLQTLYTYVCIQSIYIEDIGLSLSMSMSCLTVCMFIPIYVLLVYLYLYLNNEIK